MARQRGITPVRQLRSLSGICIHPFRECLLAVGFCLYAWSSLVLADASPLQVTLTPELRVVEQHGKDEHVSYVPAKQVLQGQEIYYTVRIVNLASEKVKHAEVVQPVPANTHLVERSATGAGAGIAYSIDGGKNFISATEVHNAMNDNPKARIRITHIRWQFRHALAPHVTVLARFRVVFD